MANAHAYPKETCEVHVGEGRRCPKLGEGEQAEISRRYCRMTDRNPLQKSCMLRVNEELGVNPNSDNANLTI